jgi:3-dehydroquinate synthase
MAKYKLVREIDVRLADNSYPILIGQGILQNKELICRFLVSKQVLIVTNTTLASFYLPSFMTILSDRQCDVVILPDGEEYKNSASLNQIYEALISKAHHRDTTLIALGGGVVGDIAGFAASTYQRGVNFIQIPTSLLAQVDASVGGKTAINHPLGKNMIGSFYQPKAVLIDLEVLKTLSLRHFRAGLAEVIKYAILVGGALLDDVRTMLAATTDVKTVSEFLEVSDNLSDIVARCCQIKAEVVQQDERESGVRALLNLGHTVGHALEAYTHYSQWLHGEAVAIGLYCAALLSHLQCGLKQDLVNEIDELLFLARLPRRIPVSVDLNALRILMNTDKKIKNNTLRFVLIRGEGDCFLDGQVTETKLEAALESAVEGE